VRIRLGKLHQKSKCLCDFFDAEIKYINQVINQDVSLLVLARARVRKDSTIGELTNQTRYARITSRAKALER